LILTVYQAEDLRAQFVCSHEGTPASTEGTPAPEGNSAPIEGTSTHTDRGGAKGEGKDKGEDKNEGESLTDREKNIEKNRQLLAPFFDALDDLKEGEPGQAIKKKRKEVKKKAEKAKEKGLGLIARIKDKRK